MNRQRHIIDNMFFNHQTGTLWFIETFNLNTDFDEINRESLLRDLP